MPGVIVGLKVEGRVDAADLDAAFKRLIREFAPQVELAMGLIGLRAVKVSVDVARYPLDGE